MALEDAGLSAPDADSSAARTHGYVFDEHGFRAIDFPHAASTSAAGMNCKGEIVGTYTDDAGLAHGFLRHSDGRFEAIDHPNAETTFLHRINDKGSIVGVYHEVAAAPRQGFLLDRGTFVPVTVSGAEATDANGINERGQIVGWYRMQGDPVSYAHGMVWENGSVRTIDLPERSTQPIDINDAGDIVGFYVNPAVVTDLADVIEAAAFFIRDGQTTTFTVPGYPYASGNGINNRQGPNGGVQVALGAYPLLSGEGGPALAFVLLEGIGGPFTSNDVPGADQTEAFDITDCGAIVGYFVQRGEPSIPPLEGDLEGCACEHHCSG